MGFKAQLCDGSHGALGWTPPCWCGLRVRQKWQPLCRCNQSTWELLPPLPLASVWILDWGACYGRVGLVGWPYQRRIWQAASNQLPLGRLPNFPWVSRDGSFSIPPGWSISFSSWLSPEAPVAGFERPISRYPEGALVGSRASVGLCSPDQNPQATMGPIWNSSAGNTSHALALHMEKHSLTGVFRWTPLWCSLVFRLLFFPCDWISLVKCSGNACFSCCAPCSLFN